MSLVNCEVVQKRSSSCHQTAFLQVETQASPKDAPPHDWFSKIALCADAVGQMKAIKGIFATRRIILQIWQLKWHLQETSQSVRRIALETQFFIAKSLTFLAKQIEHL